MRWLVLNRYDQRLLLTFTPGARLFVHSHGEFRTRPGESVDESASVGVKAEPTQKIDILLPYLLFQGV